MDAERLKVFVSSIVVVIFVAVVFGVLVADVSILSSQARGNALRYACSQSRPSKNGRRKTQGVFFFIVVIVFVIAIVVFTDFVVVADAPDSAHWLEERRRSFDAALAFRARARF